MTLQTVRSAKNPKRTEKDSASLKNSDIAELLALEAETAKMPAQKALRRASRRALMWPEEALEIAHAGPSLTELTAVGPYIERIIKDWIDKPPASPTPPVIRLNFFTYTETQAVLKRKTSWLASIKGDLQMHTTWSDGEGSIAEMADAAVERNYDYIAITDHSKGLKIAGGINEEQVREQAEEILAVNDSLRRSGKRLQVLRSIELNLNPRGEGDMDERCLAGLDVVVGCFHSSLRGTQDQTERYLAALRNRSINILGHPRGRIYNFRVGLLAEWPKVFDLAAELDKAVEIDGYPDRQDLSVDLVRMAKKSGCRISLSTDSHGPSQLRFIEYSAAIALKAGIPPDRIVNFMSREDLLRWASATEK
jgi:histidinol phosphatase-like PHP family hydrolase